MCAPVQVDGTHLLILDTCDGCTVDLESAVMIERAVADTIDPLRGMGYHKFAVR